MEDAFPSEQFLQELEFSRQHIPVFASEGARCEAVIYPILREVYKVYAANYTLWIKEPLAYDEILSGTPDYFISTRSELGMLIVGTPLIIFVEAKKNDFEQGWGQCLAELVAAQKINEDTRMFPCTVLSATARCGRFGHLIGQRNLHPKSERVLAWIICPALFGAIDAVFKAASEA